MSELVIPAGYGVLSYNFGLDGDPEPMSITVGVNAGSDPGVLQALANSKADTWAQAMPANTMVGGSRFLGCTLRMANGDVYEAIRNVVGSAGPAGLPNNCAYLLKKRTNTPGRRHRGRCYVPPFYVGEGSISQTGVLDTASHTSLQNLLRAGLPGADYVILHSTSVPGGPVPMPTPIVSWDLDTRIATQRRRLRR